MPAPRKYPPELRERAMRLVHEAREEDPELSMHQAVRRIGARVGVNADTLRGWCKQPTSTPGGVRALAAATPRRSSSWRRRCAS